MISPLLAPEKKKKGGRDLSSSSLSKAAERCPSETSGHVSWAQPGMQGGHWPLLPQDLVSLCLRHLVQN